MADDSASAALQLIDVTNASGMVARPDWFVRAEAVLRRLRPQMSADYPAVMSGVFGSGGRMSVAAVGEVVVGVAVWRILENTVFGRFLYVDDLVTEEDWRSKGVGRALLEHCEALARQAGCARLVLDSGVQRDRAHRFYFRERFVIQAFNFGKILTSADKG